MRTRISLALTVTTALAAVLIASPGAAASTEFGDNCIANQTTKSNLVSIFELSSSGPLPVAAPTSGVITKLKVNLVAAPISVPQTMKVLRVNGPTTVLTVAEITGSVAGGGSAFDARIPVQAGDHLGLYGGLPYGTLYCEVEEEITLAGFDGAGAGPGGTTPFVQESESVRVPLSAVLEPDADNDGFGDETQDKCPQSATVQVECPVIVLDSYVLPSKDKAVVLVSTSIATSVRVSGTAKLPKAPKKAGASAQAKLKKVTKNAIAGKLTRFTLNFPATLRSAVKALAPGKSITVKLQASAKDVVGRTVTDKSQLKIVG